MKSIRYLMLLELLVCFCLSCPEVQTTAYIGICEPEYVSNSLEIAREDIAAAGGPQLEFVFPSEKNIGYGVRHALRVADELSSDDRLSAVITDNGSAYSVATAHLYNRRSLVNLVPNASSPLLSGIGDWTFRMSANDEMQGRFLAEVACQNLGFSQVAVVYENTDYGRLLSHVFIDNFTACGGEIVYVAWFDRYDRAADQLIAAQIAEKEIREIFFVGYSSDFIAYLSAIKDTGTEATFLAGDSCFFLESIALLREAAGSNRVFVSAITNLLSDDAGATRFRRRFESRFGKPPEVIDEIYYECIMLLADAIKEVGPDRNALREYIMSLGNARPPYRGIVGEIGFNSRGDSAWPLTVFELGEELKLVVTQVVAPEAKGRQ